MESYLDISRFEPARIEFINQEISLERILGIYDEHKDTLLDHLKKDKEELENSLKIPVDIGEEIQKVQLEEIEKTKQAIKKVENYKNTNSYNLR